MTMLTMSLLLMVVDNDGNDFINCRIVVVVIARPQI